MKVFNETQFTFSYPGPEASNIYSDVFSAVLNNSRHVEFESSSRGLDNYYFTKRDSWRAADDVAQLR